MEVATCTPEFDKTPLHRALIESMADDEVQSGTGEHIGLCTEEIAQVRLRLTVQVVQEMISRIAALESLAKRHETLLQECFSHPSSDQKESACTPCASRRVSKEPTVLNEQPEQRQQQMPQDQDTSRRVTKEPTLLNEQLEHGERQEQQDVDTEVEQMMQELEQKLQDEAEVKQQMMQEPEQGLQSEEQQEKEENDPYEDEDCDEQQQPFQSQQSQTQPQEHANQKPIHDKMHLPHHHQPVYEQHSTQHQLQQPPHQQTEQQQEAQPQWQRSQHSSAAATSIHSQNHPTHYNKAPAGHPAPAVCETSLSSNLHSKIPLVPPIKAHVHRPARCDDSSFPQRRVEQVPELDYYKVDKQAIPVGPECQRHLSTSTASARSSSKTHSSRYARPKSSDPLNEYWRVF